MAGLRTRTRSGPAAALAAMAASALTLACMVLISCAPGRAQDYDGSPGDVEMPDPYLQAPALPRRGVSDDLAEVARIAGAAMDRGYGAVCDLKAMPSPAGGYYPCLDIGPYRFVREYGGGNTRLAGYLVAGGEPFRFMETSGAGVVLLVKGPWETDLLPRAVKFRDEITGETDKRRRMVEPESRRMAAEQRLQKFMAKERSDAETEAAKGAAGQQGTPQR